VDARQGTDRPKGVLVVGGGGAVGAGQVGGDFGGVAGDVLLPFYCSPDSPLGCALGRTGLG